MPFKQWSDDEVLYDYDMERFWIQQHHVIKTADQTVTNSTVLVPDNELSVPLLANSQYWLEVFLIYDAIQAADLKLGWAYPTSTTLDWSHGGLRGGATSTVDLISRTYLDETGFPWIGGPAAAAPSVAVVMGEGIINTAGTAGNLTLRFAQNALSATGTIMKAGSALIIQKLTV